MTLARFRAWMAAQAPAVGVVTISVLAGLGVPVAVTGAGFAAPADAAGAARCASSQVAVAVNFSHWGNPVRLGCAPWSATSTGYDALRAAGFAVTGTTRYGPAFVCRLDGYPTAGAPDHEACVSTPSAKAYWSYWHANAGQTSWTYSTLGATSYHPHAGSVDAWTFGAGAQPPFAPSAVLPERSVSPTTSAAPASHTEPTPPVPGPRTNSKPARAPTGTATGGARRPSTASKASAGATSTTGPSRSGATPTSTSAPRSTTTTSPATAKAGASTTATRAGAAAPATPSGTSSGPSIVANDAAAARPNPSGGSAWPTVAGIAVVAALAAAGGGYAWRRRRQTDHGG
jgi:hypothetical protein